MHRRRIGPLVSSVGLMHGASFGFLTIGMLWISGCAPATPEFAAEQRAAVADSVHAALQSFSEAQVAGDWGRVAAMYADSPDFLWMEDGKVMYESAADVRAALEALTSSMSAASITWIQPSVIALSPGRAEVSTLYEQSFTMAEGGGFSYAGAISAVMINGADGWQFLRGHSSSGGEAPGR